MRSELVNRDYERLVSQVLDKLFPDPNKRSAALSILLKYQEQGAHRVYLGILKESKGNLEEMKKLVDTANYDFRDLLCIAEYPHSSQKFGLREKDPGKYEKLLEQEQAEYDNWLKNVLAT
jgi:hypothetical protein